MLLKNLSLIFQSVISGARGQGGHDNMACIRLARYHFNQIIFTLDIMPQVSIILKEKGKSEFAL